MIFVDYAFEIVREMQFTKRALYRDLPEAGNADKDFVIAIGDLGTRPPR